MKKWQKFILTMIVIMLSVVSVNNAKIVKAISYSIATEYDGLSHSIRSNCVAFARYKVPSLPSGLGTFAGKKAIINTYTPVAGSIAITNGDSEYGHVAYVEAVNGNTITTLNGGFNGPVNNVDMTDRIVRKTGTPAELGVIGYWSPGGGTSFRFWGIEDGAGVSGKQKIWLKSEGFASGTSADIFLDDVFYTKIYMDQSGYFSFELDTYSISQSQHKITANTMHSGHHVSAVLYVNNVNDKHFNFSNLEHGTTIKGVQNIYFYVNGFSKNAYVDLYVDDNYATTTRIKEGGLFCAKLDTNKYSQSEHKVKAIIVDGDIQAECVRYLHFSQAYIHAIDSPGTTKIYKDNITVSGWANKLEANTIELNFYIDGVKIKTIKENELFYRDDIKYTGGYSFQHNISQLSSGSHVLQLETVTNIRTAVITRTFNVESEMLTPIPVPTIKPTATPTAEPTVEPTAEPTAEPTQEPSQKPESGPMQTLEPTQELKPTQNPIVTQSPIITREPDQKPKPIVTYKPISTISDDYDIYNLKDMRIKSFDYKKKKRQIVGKLSVSNAKVKIKVGKKGWKTAKLKGKKFTLKVGKIKKVTKIKVKVIKKGYYSINTSYWYY